MRNAVQILLSSCPKRKLVGLYQVSCIILNYAYTPSPTSHVLIGCFAISEPSEKSNEGCDPVHKRTLWLLGTYDS